MVALLFDAVRCFNGMKLQTFSTLNCGGSCAIGDVASNAVSGSGGQKQWCLTHLAAVHVQADFAAAMKQYKVKMGLGEVTPEEEQEAQASWLLMLCAGCQWLNILQPLAACHANADCQQHELHALG